MSDPLCRCSHEAGDSDCPVHPTCAECGADISGHSAIADARAKLSDCNAALVGYSEGEPGEVLRRLIAQHAIDAAEIARGDIERAKLQAEHARLTHVGVTLNNAYSARLAIVEPVCEAAKAWRAADRLFESGYGDQVKGGIASVEQPLADAIDAALAAEAKERGDRVDSIGRCSLCGYEGPGPKHDCKERP